MDFGQTHRFLPRVDIAPLVDRIRTVDPILWNSDEGMRQSLTSQRPTTSIFLWYTNAAYMPRGRRVTQADVAKRAGWDWFGPVVEPMLVRLLEPYAPGGAVVRCQIANLLPGGEIKRHTDTSPLLRISHRIHVPLVTWPEVTFYIDDIPFKFEAGEAFELNNQRFHRVCNEGTRDRYHLIFDYLPPDYDLEVIAEVQRDEARLARLPKMPN
jgi:hypothetical protein